MKKQCCTFETTSTPADGSKARSSRIDAEKKVKSDYN
ncbi:hypothetical protein CCACVL1_07853 [Corchorus capsularis]|uniref:Uncharacterized protein n=1 Tax=Corchorus capsularis TaxID=210143 RepID=A0A1R3J3J3_COCAP|nr:hypothetical protein CCACVL1_07853 [Corchorus capsularis]